MTRKEIIEEINFLEYAVNSGNDFESSLNKLISFGEPALYVVGQYLYDGGDVSSYEVWLYYFRALQIQDSPYLSDDVFVWMRWLIQRYQLFSEEYSRLEQKATEYMDGFASGELSYNNSSYRQTAVHNYEILLKEAEKLLDEDKINKIKEKIHFLQTA